MKMQTVLLALCVCLVPALAHTQTLAHRTADTAATSTDLRSGDIDARLALPIEAEGEYRWGESGEVINLYVESGKLRGYMTRRSERTDAASAPMTFAFVQAKTDGSNLRFTTKAIHGDWYSFQGSIVRVFAQKRLGKDDYLLRGTLTTHLSPAGPGDGLSNADSFVRQISIRKTAGVQQAH